MRQNSKSASRDWIVHRAVDRPARTTVVHEVSLLTLEEYALIVAAGPEAMARALFRYVRPPSSVPAEVDAPEAPHVHDEVPGVIDTPPPPPEQVDLAPSPFAPTSTAEAEPEASAENAPTVTTETTEAPVASRSDWVRRGALVSLAFLLTLASAYLILTLLGYDLSF
ncbi:MAG: hypothetical protein KatS3mg042_0063 [Rhodothermaceae bacterium]|nr:MAG: hypothetical protein KatS3mg042_0063 [Rhodothermaceae bacterium]